MIAGAALLVTLAVPAGMIMTVVVRPCDPNARAVERAVRREAELRQRRRAAEARR